MLGVNVFYPSLKDYEQAALAGIDIRTVILRCELRDASGTVIADGIGARSLQQDEGALNKALKMAEKAAHCDATLRMAGLSEVFTQDLEEPPPGPAAGTGDRITKAQHRALEASIHDLALDRDRVKSWVARQWGVEHFPELNRIQFEALMIRLPRFAANSRTEADARAKVQAAQIAARVASRTLAEVEADERAEVLAAQLEAEESFHE
jgi:hypothetical protein